MPVARPCLDCGEFTTGTRCDLCATTTRKARQRAQDSRRGTSTARGYGKAHQDIRAALAPLVASGRAVCWRCERPIRPSQPWHLGHDARRQHAGPEHARCNIDASNRTGEVVLVAGPPCAGKTTYVAEVARDGDLVLDRDVMGATRYDEAVDRLVRDRMPAWVIRSLPGPTRRRAFADRIGADRVVLLWPDTATLLDRARARPHRAQAMAAVRSWLEREALDS